MEVDNAQNDRVAMNPDAQHRPATGANVLFQPANAQVIGDENAKFDDEMEVSSAKTNPGASGTKSGGVAITDKSLLIVQKIRCCICGIMTEPNSSNTCINCLKGQIDITEGI